MRDYGIPPVVWGGDNAACGHEWGDEGSIHAGGQQKNEHGGQRVGRDFAAQNAVRDRTTGQFCCRCGAWRGSLGLEPAPDCGRQFLELRKGLTEKERAYVFSELKKLGLVE